MIKTNILLLSAALLTLLGCAPTPSTTSNPANSPTTSTPAEQKNNPTANLLEPPAPAENHPPSTRPTRPRFNDQSTNDLSYQNPFQATQRDNDIYCYEKKVGHLENGRLYMNLDDKEISFLLPQNETPSPENTALDLDQLSCHSESYTDGNYTYSNFSYLGLEFSTRVFGPYAIYQAIDTPEANAKISLQCDSSLVQSGDKYDQDVPFLDCQSNGSDLLSQFEFSAEAGHPLLTTGGEYSESWKKIFIKKVQDRNYFFIGNVSDQFADAWIVGDPVGEFRKKTSEESLSRLTNTPEIANKLAKWQEMVKSFEVR